MKHFLGIKKKNNVLLFSFHFTMLLLRVIVFTKACLWINVRQYGKS